MERFEFIDTEDGSRIPFYLLEQTTFGGEQYALVTDLDPDDEDALAHILKVTGDDGTDMTYEEVDDEALLAVLSGIFEELLGDTELV